MQSLWSSCGWRRANQHPGAVTIVCTQPLLPCLAPLRPLHPPSRLQMRGLCRAPRPQLQACLAVRRCLHAQGGVCFAREQVFPHPSSILRARSLGERRARAGSISRQQLHREQEEDALGMAGCRLQKEPRGMQQPLVDRGLFSIACGTSGRAMPVAHPRHQLGSVGSVVQSVHRQNLHPAAKPSLRLLHHHILHPRLKPLNSVR